MTDPKKWTEVYPYGTKEGDEETIFFKALIRKNKYDYMSTAALIKETGLSRQRVEEILEKYVSKFNPPLIYPHPTNSEHWGYWQNCKDQIKTDHRNLSEKAKDSRIDSHIKGTNSA